MLRVVTVFCAYACLTDAVAEDPPLHFNRTPNGANEIRSYTVMSPYQGRATSIEVLLPDHLRSDVQYPVLYILPVNDGTDGPWGSGIREAQRWDIQNIYEVICVAPEYDYTPWFGDNPSDPKLQQESYLLNVVIPFVEDRYPTMNCKEGRVLLGFSKSGFGAVAIFLRHLDFIGKAAAWDAPLTSLTILPGEDEMLQVFATEDNYRKYCIPSLIEAHAAELRAGSPRLTLVNNGIRPGSVTRVHEELSALGIRHRYADDVRREHAWTSGWMPVVARLLFEARSCTR